MKRIRSRESGLRPGVSIEPVLSRRRLLAVGGALLLGGCADRGPTERRSPAGCDSGSSATAIPYPGDLADPFRLGVASGDPLPSSVLLWSRLAPEPASVAAGVPVLPIAVGWELSLDDGFRRVVAAGREVAVPELGHSLHVEVSDLEPATTYWYRFTAGSYSSPVGRTRTAPMRAAQVDEVRLAVASCQAWQSGYFTPYEHLAADELDLVLFVGDFIYELEASRTARPHGLTPARTLAEYRAFYSLNRSDALLQAAQAAHPWVAIWDDHEVEDNYAGLDPGGIGSLADPDAAARFPSRRAAAYQAWWENMPVRGCPPIEGALSIYRDLRFGDLLHLVLLDDRQYRSPIARGEGAGNLPRFFGGGPQLPAAFDPSRTMLGSEQEAWLRDRLRGHRDARWTLLGQQTLMAQVDRAPDDPARGFSMDAWDGYVAARNRLMADVRAAGIENLVSLGGDIHASAVTDLVADHHAAGAPVVGTELIAPSISAVELLPDDLVAGALRNAHVHEYETRHRGYLRCTLRREHLLAEYRWVESTASPSAAVVPGPVWTVDRGRPGARRVA